MGKQRSKKFVSRKTKFPRSRTISITPSEPLLQAYLREIRKYPMLTREAEKELAIRYSKTGDREAFHALITSNLRFVVKIAYEYIHYRMKILDLIQEGNMGLVKAMQEFDPYKEVRLTTYAVWWIRSYIQDALLRNYSLVKIGTTQAQKKLFYHLRREQRRLEEEGISPQQSVKLLASRLDVREKDVREMSQRLSQSDVSLNNPIKDEDGKRDHLQNLVEPGRPADEILADTEQRELFRRILYQFGSTLIGREKVIFEQRLISENPATLQAIGDQYGITKERTRQIEEEIKQKLLEYVKQHYPDYEILKMQTSFSNST